MSQQMEFDEVRSEQRGSSFHEYESGYRDPFVEAAGQKVSLHQAEKGPSAKQRFTLAIVSLCVLLFTSLVAIGFLTNGGHSITTPAIILLCIIIALFCFTTMAVNAFFNGYGDRSK
jgi:ACR3 family arsenite efflux pump ArsB